MSGQAKESEKPADKHVRFHAGDKVEISEACEFEFVTHKGHGYVRLPRKIKTTVKKKKVGK